MNVACSALWGGSRSTKPCVFPCKVAAAGDERYLVCAAVVAGAVLVPPLCSATSEVVPVCVVLCISYYSCLCTCPVISQFFFCTLMTPAASTLTRKSGFILLVRQSASCLPVSIHSSLSPAG